MFTDTAGCASMNNALITRMCLFHRFLCRLCCGLQSLGEEEDADGARALSRTQPGAATSLENAFKQFALGDPDLVDPSIIPHVLHAAMDLSLPPDELRDFLSAFVHPHDASGGKGVTLQAFQDLLLSETLRPQQVGRHYAVLSLAEAETVRRIMHVRGKDIGRELNLRVLPMDFAVLDSVCASASEVSANDAHPLRGYQTSIAKQCLRYFDGELTYSERDIGSLLRGVQGSACRRRQLFFEQTIGCRRRMRRKWESTPLAKVFSLRSEFHLLKQRGLVVRMRLSIQCLGLTFYEAFKAFNSTNNGLLSPGELWAAMDFLRVTASVTDVIDMMRTCDADGDGNLSWGEFAEMLRWNDDVLSQCDKTLLGVGAVLQVNPVNIDAIALTPKEPEQIVAKWKQQDREAATQAAEELHEYRAMEEQRKVWCDAYMRVRRLSTYSGTWMVVLLHTNLGEVPFKTQRFEGHHLHWFHSFTATFEIVDTHKASPSKPLLPCDCSCVVMSAKHGENKKTCSVLLIRWTSRWSKRRATGPRASAPTPK